MLSDVQLNIGKLQGTLETFVAEQRGAVTSIEIDAYRLEKRVRSVEGWRWYLSGAIAIIGLGLSAFVFI